MTQLEAEKVHHVIITEGHFNREKIAQVIVATTGESMESAVKRLTTLPIDFAFCTKDEAVRFAKAVTNAGGKATVKTS